MQVTVEKADKLERHLKVLVPFNDVEQEVTSRLRRVGKTARLKGFRPGKVPPKVVRQHYGGQVRAEVVDELTRSSFVQALRDENLNPAGEPKIEFGKVAEGEDLEYTAVFEVYPEVELAKTEGLKATRREASVEESDIDAMLERLRDQRAEWVEVERSVAEGDTAVIDFVGRIDGEEFEGGKGSDYPVVVGSGGLIEDLEQGLMGLAAGDEKTVDVTFPEAYHAETLAGKAAQFDVAVKAVKERTLPEIDEAFIHSFGGGEADLESFRLAVRGNMEREAAEKSAAELRQQILADLVEHNPVELPNVLVEREIEHLQKDSMQRFGIKDADALPREPFEAQARKRVALGLLVGEVLKRKEITVDADKLDARIMEVAAGYGDADAAAAHIRTDPQMLQHIETMVLEEQVVERLVADGDVTIESVSFNELMDVK